ncbi:CBM20 domain-containing protein [Arthrobacter sp. ZGTC412]|uniref:CBM20 domain-containing protein n=1 Tax=Arthrobacter sp. ZGTC412 TaxID=2058900 RepID=UPI000CE5213F|nr:CBM20 domain-containing protein [Arthrobacter sp. ZGTC412]
MSIAWPAVLMQLLTTAASAVAGKAANAAATAATANPIIGAAADAAAAKATEKLLGEFLPAQQQELRRIEEFTRDIHGLAGDINMRVKALQGGPSRAALLHMEYASRHPERAYEELQAARGLLFQAWGIASDASQRAFAAQQLSGVYALLGDSYDSRQWLEKCLPDTDLAVEDAICDLLTALRVVLNRSPSRASSEDYTRVTTMETGARYVPVRDLHPALSKVVDARHEAMLLRRLSMTVGIGAPWPSLSRTRIQNDGDSEILVQTPTAWVKVEIGAALRDSPTVATMRRMETMTFRVKDGPWNAQAGQVFLFGPSPQLGAWEPAQAVPMEGLQGLMFGCDGEFMMTSLQLLKEGDSIEYCYYFVPHDGGPAATDLIRRKPFPTGQSYDPLEALFGGFFSHLAPYDTWGKAG